MTLKNIECHTLQEHQKLFADYMPGGDLFNGKSVPGNNVHDFLLGLAEESVRAEAYLKSYQSDYIPDKTNIFLDDWESALGIPDNCFTGAGTNDERRRDILVKLASLGIQTVDDFQNLANLFGVTVNVIPGQDFLPLPPDPKFTIVIEFTASAGFPFTFPFTFGDETIAQLECLFNNLKPANCVTQFVQI